MFQQSFSFNTFTSVLTCNCRWNNLHFKCGKTDIPVYCRQISLCITEFIGQTSKHPFEQFSAWKLGSYTSFTKKPYCSPPKLRLLSFFQLQSQRLYLGQRAKELPRHWKSSIGYKKQAMPSTDWINCILNTTDIQMFWLYHEQHFSSLHSKAASRFR